MQSRQSQGSPVFHFLNCGPIGAPSRPVAVSAETVPLSLLPLLTPAVRRSCNSPAKIPTLSTPRHGGPGPSSCRAQLTPGAGQGIAQPDHRLGALGQSQHTHGLDHTAAPGVWGRGRAGAGCEGATAKGRAGALYWLEKGGSSECNRANMKMAQASILEESAREPRVCSR